MTNEIYAGIMSGFSQALIGHPLDTVKVLMQNNTSIKNISIYNLYKGFQYPLYYKIITKGLCFDINNKIQKYEITKNPFLSGFITGIFLTPISHSLDLYKIRRQTSTKIIKLDFLNIRGICITLSRDSIAYSLYIGSYQKLRDYEFPIAYAGALSGLINWTISYPLDVIRTRLITYPTKTIKECIKMGSLNKGYVPCAIRAILTSSVGFSIYETVLNYLN